MLASSADEFLLPLFPLPNLVFFPNTRLPLHVFEPRYRQLVADVLQTDSRFGIVLLRPGWKSDYYGQPDVHPCGTIGTIEQAVSIEDGRYNILVRGDVRFRIVGEIPALPYRTARVVVQPESHRGHDHAVEQREWLATLSRQYLKYLPDQMDVPEIETVELDALANALIMSLNLDAEEKQKLLEVDDLLERAQRIGEELHRRIESMSFLAPYRRHNDPNLN